LIQLDNGRLLRDRDFRSRYFRHDVLPHLAPIVMVQP
jgi:hypothetical protein